MNIDEYPDLTNLKLIAIGKAYISRTHQNSDAVPLQRAVEIIEEYNASVLAFIKRLNEEKT
ncbi:hypothetical protein LCGC14_0303160 [marine sediment metagenome]|uniref:Uncharacterized protein n=1 Tax=marine sediment metagenome TaxID=412755 RepID=A0A0F9TPQ4_9ZZZZ